MSATSGRTSAIAANGGDAQLGPQWMEKQSSRQCGRTSLKQLLLWGIQGQQSYPQSPANKWSPGHILHQGRLPA